VSFPGKPFQPCLKFVGRARSLPKSTSHRWALALPTSIRLDWKGLPGTNTLAYYENSSITAVKRFITLAPAGQQWFKREQIKRHFCFIVSYCSILKQVTVFLYSKLYIFHISFLFTFPFISVITLSSQNRHWCILILRLTSKSRF